MPRQIGSQYRETLEEAGMEVEERMDDETVILRGIHNKLHLELWIKNDDFAGHVIEIDGVGYEFVTDELK